MSASIQAAKWLGFMEREYLQGFIKDGGCSVKFAVALDELSDRSLRDGVAQAGERMGYRVASVSAGETKINLIDEIFFRVAGQLDWRELSRQVIRGLAAEKGYTWPNESDEGGEIPLSERIASENKADPQMLLLELKTHIGIRVFKERKLAKDFRVAMTHLCLAELAGGTDGAQTIGVLTEWLAGRNRTVGAVKPYQIFRKINRANARFFLESMVHWVRMAGNPGILLLMDTARLMLSSNPKDNSFYYSKASVLDSYEVLREFIDGADRFSGYFMVVLPGPDFLEDQSRGLGAYEALKFRVIDEIRDKRLVNPMGSLVRIASGQGGVIAN